VSRIFKNLSVSDGLSHDLREQIYEHALEQYPHESCGIITKDMNYVALQNHHDDPASNFMISPSDWLRYSNEIFGVIHSHTNGNMSPSHQDMVSQSATAVPWGVVLVDEKTPRTPVIWFGDTIHSDFLGLSFIYGAQDCYSLIRDYYWVKMGLHIADFPRWDKFWEEDDPVGMYIANFEKAGFVEVHISEIKNGDVVLMRVGRASCMNHGGVYDNNLIYHHLNCRISTREPIANYSKYIERVLRFADESKLIKHEPRLIL
jgi:proteasome lid subunit RPN8/RPN11